MIESLGKYTITIETEEARITQPFGDIDRDTLKYFRLLCSIVSKLEPTSASKWQIIEFDFRPIFFSLSSAMVTY